MGRAPRADMAGGIYHALNRGNAKLPIFSKDQDYEAFDRIIVEGLEQFPVDLIAYQWMNNHWHMVSLARSESRGIPFGSEKWVEKTVKQFQLQSTMRPRRRPKKLPK